MKLLPNKLQLDVLKRHVGPFIFCFITIVFLLLMQFLILFINRLIGKGLPTGVIIELIITNLASMVVLAMPMAVLVASLMAFGKVTELNELTALKAAGVNPIHLITPVITASILLSIFLVWFSNDVLPNANQRARSLFIDIRMKNPDFNLKANEFYNGIDDYTFLVKNIKNNPDGPNTLNDVTIFQQKTNDQKEAFIKARKGYLKNGSHSETMTLHLRDGSILRHMDDQKKETVEKTKFKRYRLSFDLSEMAFSRSNPEKRSRTDRTMNMQSMKAVVDTLDHQVKQQQKRMLAKNRYIVPTVNKHGRVNREHKFVYQNKSNLSPPYKSHFWIANDLSSEEAQKKLHRLTMSSLHNYKSSFNNLITDRQWRIEKIASYMVEIHKKFSIPFACLVFVLLGAPIGMYTKKGNLGYAALIGTVFLTLFWISIIQGEKLADRLAISPVAGMWGSDILLGGIGIILIIQLCTPFSISTLWKGDE